MLKPLYAQADPQDTLPDAASSGPVLAVAWNAARGGWQTVGVDGPFRLGSRAEIVPSVEMFNTFNNANNVNPLSSPALFNFDGFLRLGVGDPLQAQLSLRFNF